MKNFYHQYRVKIKLLEEEFETLKNVEDYLIDNEKKLKLKIKNKN